MKNQFSYQCSGYVNGKICDNAWACGRELLHERLLARVKSDLLSDDSVERFKQTIRKRVAKADLGNAPIDVERGRELLRGLPGEIRIAAQGGYLVANMGRPCPASRPLGRFG
jgi:hypothetical protein